MADKDKEQMDMEEAESQGEEKVAGEQGSESYEEVGDEGSEKVAGERDRDFYEEIGKKAGEKVRELIEKGKGDNP